MRRVGAILVAVSILLQTAAFTVFAQSASPLLTDVENPNPQITEDVIVYGSELTAGEGQSFTYVFYPSNEGIGETNISYPQVVDLRADRIIFSLQNVEGPATRAGERYTFNILQLGDTMTSGIEFTTAEAPASTPTPTPTPTPVPTTAPVLECTDPDNGSQDIYTFNFATYNNNAVQDYCSGDVLYEAVCSSTTIASYKEPVTCQYGCSNGACLKAPTTSGTSTPAPSSTPTPSSTPAASSTPTPLPTVQPINTALKIDNSFALTLPTVQPVNFFAVPQVDSPKFQFENALKHNSSSNLGELSFMLGQSQFKDIAGQWFEPAVNRLALAGAISGRKNADGSLQNIYDPSSPVNYAEAMKLAFEASGLGKASGTTTVAQAKGQWFEGYFVQIENKFPELKVLPVFNAQISPAAPASRIDAACLIAASFDLKKLNVSTNQAINFPDVSALSLQQQECLKDVFAAGIMKGDDSGKFRPLDNLNRAEIAVTLQRAQDFVAQKTALSCPIQDPGKTLWKNLIVSGVDNVVLSRVSNGYKVNFEALVTNYSDYDISGFDLTAFRHDLVNTSGREFLEMIREVPMNNNWSNVSVAAGSIARIGGEVVIPYGNYLYDENGHAYVNLSILADLPANKIEESFDLYDNIVTYKVDLGASVNPPKNKIIRREINEKSAGATASGNAFSNYKSSFVNPYQDYMEMWSTYFRQQQISNLDRWSKGCSNLNFTTSEITVVDNGVQGDGISITIDGQIKRTGSLAFHRVPVSFYLETVTGNRMKVGETTVSFADSSNGGFDNGVASELTRSFSYTTKIRPPEYVLKFVAVIDEDGLIAEKNEQDNVVMSKSISFSKKDIVDIYAVPYEMSLENFRIDFDGKARADFNYKINNLSSFDINQPFKVKLSFLKETDSFSYPNEVLFEKTWTVNGITNGSFVGIQPIEFPDVSSLPLRPKYAVIFKVDTEEVLADIDRRDNVAPFVWDKTDDVNAINNLSVQINWFADETPTSTSLARMQGAHYTRVNVDGGTLPVLSIATSMKLSLRNTYSQSQTSGYRLMAYAIPINCAVSCSNFVKNGQMIINESLTSIATGVDERNLFKEFVADESAEYLIISGIVGSRSVLNSKTGRYEEELYHVTDASVKDNYAFKTFKMSNGEVVEQKTITFDDAYNILNKIGADSGLLGDVIKSVVFFNL